MKKILPLILLFIAFFVFACNNEKTKYKATFYVGDEVYLEKTVVKGEKVIRPGDPTKEGFEFLYWSLNSAEYDFNTPVNSDIALYAEWNQTVVAEFFDIELISDGEIVKTISVGNGEPLRSLSTVKLNKEFYTFSGWYYNDQKIEDGYVPTSDMVLEAKWEPLGEICVISLDGKETEILKGYEFTLPFETREGYAFAGWRDRDYNIYNGTIVVEGDMTLRSVWKTGLSDVSTCTVSLENFKSLTFIYQESYQLPDFYKLGFKFIGWTDGTYKYLSGATYVAVGNVTLTPIFEELGLSVDEEKILYAVDNVDYLVEYELHFPLTDNVSLPTTDENGVSITWSSSDDSIMSDEGVITRKMTAEHKLTVKMTATFKINNEEEVKEYTFEIKRELKDISKSVIGGYMTPGNDVSDVALETLDVINGAFLYFDGQAQLMDADGYAKRINDVLEKAHAKGVRVVVSLGAQSADVNSRISTIAQKEILRKKFAENLLEFVLEYNFDGVDMDWETPSDDIGEDKLYTLVMKEIYETFKAYDSELLVTSAIGAGPWLPHNFDLSNSIQYHDYINMMSYDLQHPNKSTHHNALYKSTKGYYWQSGCSIDDTVKIYANQYGVPKEKIIVGIPFYGRICTDTLGIGKAGTFDGSVNQKTIQEYLKTTTEQWDDECKVPYIYIEETKTFITYDNPRSIAAKIEYVETQGLGGVMYWQNAQDYNDLLITAIKDNMASIK